MGIFSEVSILANEMNYTIKHVFDHAGIINNLKKNKAKNVVFEKKKICSFSQLSFSVIPDTLYFLSL